MPEELCKAQERNGKMGKPTRVEDELDRCALPCTPYPLNSHPARRAASARQLHAFPFRSLFLEWSLMTTHGSGELS